MYHSMNLKTLQKIQNEMTRENAYIITVYNDDIQEQ